MATFNRPTRVWVNQPSKHQPLHHLHGTVGVAWTDPDGFTNLYFTTGKVHSMRVPAGVGLEIKNSQADVFEYGPFKTKS